MRSALLVVLLLSSAPSFAGGLVQERENNWTQCLWASFASQKRETHDKNLAAERAFAARKTEEEELLSIEGTALFFPHLKTEVKRMLVKGEPLQIAPGLHGIDVPEHDQLCRGDDSLPHRCGAKAANELDGFIARRPVSCEPVDREYPSMS